MNKKTANTHLSLSYEGCENCGEKMMDYGANSFIIIRKCIACEHEETYNTKNGGRISQYQTQAQAIRTISFRK